MGWLDFLKRGPSKKACARCGRRAAHGYSPAAESDSSQIMPLCLACLTDQLRQDYEEFRGRAVVIAPAKGLPCYVFRNREFLRSVSAGSERDLDALLEGIGKCADCGAEGRCAWIDLRGASGKTLGDVLEKGLQQTISMPGSPALTSLCLKCTANKVGEGLKMDGLEYFEVCSPHGTDEGVVLPMGY